jgi:hypothetical protein
VLVAVFCGEDDGGRIVGRDVGKVQVTVIKLRHDPRDCVGAEPRRDGTAKVHVHLAVAGLHVQSSQRGRVV